MPWDFALILALLAFAVPLMGRYRIRQLLGLAATTSGQRLRLYASTVFSQWIAAAVILWRCRVHGVSLDELGMAIPMPRLTVLVALGLAGLLVANQILAVQQIEKQPDKANGVMPRLALRIFPQNTVERLAFVSVVTTVSVCEEFIYRGFVQWTFQNWAAGRVWVGIVASAIFFGTAHLYQGRQGVAATGVMGLVFSAVRAWTMSLLPCVAAHFVTDLTVGLLAPARLVAVRQRE